MEKPVGVNTENIRRARAKALQSLHVDYSRPVTKGQYESYRSGPDMDPGSKTETFFRVFLKSDDPRFAGVEFELESGKGLAESSSNITTTTVAAQVYFKNTDANMEMKEFKIQPVPGTVYESYIKIYADALAGDQTLFVSMEEIIAEWELTDDLLKRWAGMPLVIYKDGANPEDIR
jgi:glucose-6-phosphate 1-dehydrogenase